MYSWYTALVPSVCSFILPALEHFHLGPKFCFLALPEGQNRQDARRSVIRPSVIFFEVQLYWASIWIVAKAHGKGGIQPLVKFDLEKCLGI